MGLFAAALRWIDRPAAGWSGLAGLFAGAIVLSHGTEVYTSGLGLAVIALVRWRHIAFGRLTMHGPLAVALAGVVAAPYVPTLLGWVGAGGAISVGAAVVAGAAT